MGGSKWIDLAGNSVVEPGWNLCKWIGLAPLHRENSSCAARSSLFCSRMFPEPQHTFASWSVCIKRSGPTSTNGARSESGLMWKRLLRHTCSLAAKGTVRWTRSTIIWFTIMICNAAIGEYRIKYSIVLQLCDCAAITYTNCKDCFLLAMHLIHASW